MKYSVKQPPTQKQFLANIEEKMSDIEFTQDIHIILKPGVDYNNETAWSLVNEKLISKI